MINLPKRRSLSLFGLPEASVLFVYTATVSLLLPFHESWGDEVTAWLLSRDSSLSELFGHLLRIEGTPGLWHLLLWCFARLHLSFTSVHWACVLLASGGIYLLLRFCPLPRFIKLLLPFGFYLAYQYVVVARSYVLFPLFLFAATAILCSSRFHPVLLAVVLGLLANTSAHGAVYSVALVGVIAWNRWKHRDLFSGVPHVSALTPVWKRSFLILILFWAAAVATAIPMHLHALSNLQAGKHPGPSMSRQAAEPATLSSAWVSPQASLASTSQPDAVREQPPSASRLQNFVWIHTHAQENATHRETLVAHLLYAGMILLSLLTFPLSTSNSLAVLFLLLLLFFLWQRKALILLLPYVAMLLLCMLTQVKEHHTGLLWMSLIAVVWSAWHMPVLREKIFPKATANALLAILSLIAALQIVWTIQSAYNDVHLPYTGDAAAAHFVANLPPRLRVISGRGAVATEPPLYEKHLYSTANPNTLGNQPLLAPMLLQRPDVVVVGDLLVGNQDLHNQWFILKEIGASEIQPGDLEDLQRLHYQQTNRFCGESFMHAGYSHQLCQYIYEPIPQARTESIRLPHPRD